MPALPDPLTLVVVEDSGEHCALIVANLAKSVIRWGARRVDPAGALREAPTGGLPDAVIPAPGMPPLSSFEGLRIVARPTPTVGALEWLVRPLADRMDSTAVSAGRSRPRRRSSCSPWRRVAAARRCGRRRPFPIRA